PVPPRPVYSRNSVRVFEEPRDLDRGLEGPVRASGQRGIGTIAELHRAARGDLLGNHVVARSPRAIGSGVELVAPEPIMPDEQAPLLQPMSRGVHQGTRNRAIIADRGVTDENLPG